MKDERIVTLVKRGEKERYGVVVERYEGALGRYIGHLINQRGEEVEDLVQETFIRAYENLEGFEEGKKFSSWIYRIAHNLAVDYMKKKKVATEGMGEEEWREIEDGIDIEKEMIEEGEKKILVEAVKRLERGHKEMLLLFYVEEKSYDEIGEILRISKSNVGVRLKRAKEKLKILLDNKV